MAILGILLGVVSVALIAADDSCPAANAIDPCTCDGEGLNCMKATTLEQIKKAFRANFKYGGIRGVWIQGTPITNIPGDLFGTIKAQQVYIEVNNIATVDFNAFSASKKTLSTLSLYGNKLDKLNYSGLSDYEVLGTLNLGKNQITSIPDNAFNSGSLFTIILAQNSISSVGQNAFSNLPNLGKIELTSNYLKSIGPMAFAMKSHSAQLQINLASNQITSVSSSAFQGTSPLALLIPYNNLASLPSDPFAGLVQRIGQKRGFVDLTGNPLSCTGCDEYSWLVINKNALHTVLNGFTCNDGQTLLDLTSSGIGC